MHTHNANALAPFFSVLQTTNIPTNIHLRSQKWQEVRVCDCVCVRKTETVNMIAFISFSLAFFFQNEASGDYCRALCAIIGDA